MERYNIILLSVITILVSVLPSCQKENLSPDSDQPTATIDSLNLTLSLNVAPVAETKGSARVATKGSEAEKAGFYYEFVPDTTVLIQTKAPTSLKNIYAFLFNGTTGAYVGKGTLSSASSNTKLDIKFSQTSATNNCRLIVVAQDGNATLTLPSTLTGFTGTYDQFKTLYLSDNVTSDANIPYVGELTGVSAVSGSVGSNYIVNIYRMLAKVALNVTNSSAFSSLSLSMNNVPEYKYFGTSNKYDGSGTTPTTGTFEKSDHYGTSFTWYVGENVRGSIIGSCTNMQDRNVSNAPLSATYITVNGSFSNSTFSGGIVYDIYLGTGIAAGTYGDFNLRRNHNYIINSTISGTLEDQIALSKLDKRIHSISIYGSNLFTIPASGGSVSVPLVLPDEDSWSIAQSTGEPDVFTCDMTRGTGSGTVTFTAPANLRGREVAVGFRCEFNGWDEPFIGISQESMILPPVGSYTANYQVISYLSEKRVRNYNEASNFCSSLYEDGYGDWYLPSKRELQLLFTNNLDLGSNYRFEGIYWSSTYIIGSPYRFVFVRGIEEESIYYQEASSLESDILDNLQVRCVRRWY